MSTNRAALINKTYRVLKKHYKPFGPPAERNLFEHIIYACLLENSSADQADQAFAILLQEYFDFNEARVTSLTELTDKFSCLEDPAAAARRLKSALQSLFESYYTFNLEEELKNRNQKNLGAAVKFLEVKGVPEYAVQYATQHGLGGHSIPINAGALKAAYVIGIASESEAAKGRVPGLERTIPKAKGIEFASLLHQLGADFHSSPHSTKLKNILLEIAPDAKERMPKRETKKSAKAKKKSAGSKTAKKKATPAPKKTTKKKAAKKTTAKKAAKKTATKKAATKKSPSKKLTRKKPK